MNVTVKTNLTQLRQERRKQATAMLSSAGKACRDAVGVYYKWIAQFAPPNIGRKEIDPKLYERPAMLLPIAIARGSANLAEDRAALANGYSWKVVRKKKAPLYFKSKGETQPPAVKKARHIVNRGLLRWAFVGVLPDAGVAVPVDMRPLAAAKRGKYLKKNERLVASATLAVASKELIIRVRQHVESAGKNRWFDTAARIAEKQHDKYLSLRLNKYGKVETR